jgi:hypothetical protein
MSSMISWTKAKLIFTLFSTFTICVSAQAVCTVLVYGATPAGILAAVASADENVSTCLLDPRLNNLGGMMTGGLANTDIGTTTDVLGGRTRTFFTAIGEYYYPQYSPPRPEWNFEPSVALRVFAHDPRFLGSGKVNIALGSRIVKVTKNGAHIVSVTLVNGTVIPVTVVIDATYEGSLLPLSGVSYSFGRESTEVFNESVAGVLPEPHFNSTPSHPFTSQGQLWEQVSPYYPNGTTVIPLIGTPPGPVGSGDDRLQAFNVRVTLTSNLSNMLQPWPRPAMYNSSWVELFKRYVISHNATTFYQSGLGPGKSLPFPPGLTASKYDPNSQRLDFQTLNYGFAQAVAANDFNAQEAILESHRQLTLAYYYFLQNDPDLPQSLRDSMDGIGLPLDEHIDCGHLPCQVYVREALRMQSDFIFTQADREINFNKSDSIGVGAYTIDVMHGSIYPDKTYSILQEGGMQAPSFLPAGLPTFQIPYRAIVPKRNQCDNLLVPTAVSSSHVGFCAIRVEPTWMVLGESAGIAAAQFVQSGIQYVQDLNISLLQKRLVQLGQVI